MPGKGRTDAEGRWIGIRTRLGQIAGTQGPPGPAGQVRIVWRGAWADSTDYHDGDIVYRDHGLGSGLVRTYICTETHTSAGDGPTPGGTTYWHELNESDLIIDGSRAMVGDLDMSEHQVLAVAALAFDTSPTYDDVAGAAAWDPTTYGRPTVRVSTDVVLPYGGVYARVRNGTGSLIAAGSPVRALSSVGDGTLYVEPATVTVTSGGQGVIGLAMADIDDGEAGYVCCHGDMAGPDFSSWSSGDVLYVTGGGGLYTAPPGKGCGLSIRMGWVTGTASFFVAIERMPDLGELSNCHMDANGGPHYYDVPQWLPYTEGCDAYRDYPPSLFPTRAVSSDADVAEKNVVLFADASGGAVTLTLPPASGAGSIDGRRLDVLKVDGTRNAVIIVGDGGDLIDDEDEFRLVLPGEAVTLFCDQANDGWRIL